MLLKQTKETEAAAAISAVHAQLQHEQSDEVKTRELTSSSSSLSISIPNEIKPGLVASTSTTANSNAETVVSVPDRPSLKPNRCGACNKRVGLSGFKCRCGGLFCASHRYNDKHECTYDFKAAGRELITKANPVIKATKITKI
jgi:predicted nucleic acid binding AN1-type Zn finger protein